jgi:hypothetical protein
MPNDLSRFPFRNRHMNLVCFMFPSFSNKKHLGVPWLIRRKTDELLRHLIYHDIGIHMPAHPVTPCVKVGRIRAAMKTMRFVFFIRKTLLS